MRRLIPKPTVALVVVLLTAACATGSGRAGNTLEGTTWRIVEVDDMPVERVEDLNLAPHLRVLSAEGEVNGAGGCNRFSGPYRADGTSVAFGPLVTTRMACADPGRQAMEDRILDALQSADGYRIEGRWLWLMEAGQVRLTAEVWR